jgi:hypothetical protein
MSDIHPQAETEVRPLVRLGRFLKDNPVIPLIGSFPADRRAGDDAPRHHLALLGRQHDQVRHPASPCSPPARC